MHEYRALGMHIDSELSLALPSAPRDEVVPTWQVSIRLGTVESDLPMPHRLGRIHYGEFGTDLQVDVPWAGRYRVRGDSRIDVQPAPSADEKTVGLYITDLILSFLVRRHPFLTLHGSAVSGPKGGLIFLGDRGSGKSATATAMTRSGYQWLCDDVVPIAAGPVVFPGIPVSDGAEKYKTELGTSHTPALLHLVFVLEAANVAQLEIVQLRGRAKMASLFPHICSSPGIDDSRDLLSKSIQLLGQGPVFKVNRPIVCDNLNELIEEIKRIDSETI